MKLQVVHNAKVFIRSLVGDWLLFCQCFIMIIMVNYQITFLKKSFSGAGGFLPAMKQIGNVAALPGIVHVSTFSENLLFFCSHLPGIIAFQMGILSWQEVWTKVLLKAVCVLGICVWIRSTCKGRLQNEVRKGSSHLLHCFSFDIQLFVLFQLLEPRFPTVHTDCLLILNWRSVERAGGGTVVCIIVTGLMSSEPSHAFNTAFPHPLPFWKQSIR